MARLRQFCIVFHNVRQADSKTKVENFFQSMKPIKFLQAIEKYPESEGYHIHVFVAFTNPREFKSMLSNCQRLSQTIIETKPEGCETDWGRVQCDQMFGTFEQATAYLRGETKDKPIDGDEVKVIETPGKGQIKCDVCQKIYPWLDCPFQYNNPRSSGRCRMCCCIPHRVLIQAGHKVRDLDSKIRGPA